jgi:putative Holliday junction resolvase
MSDPTGTIASPLLTIHRVAEKTDMARIAELVLEHSVERVVVGLPRTLRGELGPQARKVMRFADHLAKVVEVPVVYWDERHSTIDAERIVRSRKRGRGKRGGIDEVAAAVILQNYLDSLHPSQPLTYLDSNTPLQSEEDQ